MGYIHRFTRMGAGGKGGKVKSYDYVIFISFILLFVLDICVALMMKRKKKDFKGELPVHPFLYKTCKGFCFLLWILFPASALFHSQALKLPGTLFIPSDTLCSIAALLTVLSVVIVIVSFINLGNSLKMGLPGNDRTELVVNGLYRVSRNPIYVSFLFIAVAAFLYLPNIVIAFLSAYTVAVHHLIILSEEKFLIKRFGRSYENYKRKVGRYFGVNPFAAGEEN